MLCLVLGLFVRGDYDEHLKTKSLTLQHLSPYKPIKINNIITTKNKNHHIALKTKLNQPIKNQLLLNIINHITNINATVHLINNKKTTHFTNTQINKSNAFPNVSLSTVLNKTNHQHPLLKTTQHTTYFNQLKLIKITNQNKS